MVIYILVYTVAKLPFFFLVVDYNCVDFLVCLQSLSIVKPIPFYSAAFLTYGSGHSILFVWFRFPMI